jgi:YaiO family outer membrane protein
VVPTYRDALEALTDVELWGKDFLQALAVANEGLFSYPHDEDLLIKKARALNGLGRDEESLQILLKVEEIDPSRSEILSMMESITAHSVMNSVGASYAVDHFSDVYDNMHYLSFQLSRQTPYGSAFARLNYSSRFAERGLQVETDLYPRIADGLYAYVNYGYSQSMLFPRHRVGAEVYGKLPASFEASIGLRHLYFNPSSSVTIYTGTLGYYVGNYWLSFRPYFIPNNAGISNSASVTLRRYFGEAETFLSLHAGAGFSADERAIQSSTGFSGQEVFYLKSQTIGLGWQQNLGSTSLLIMSLDLTNQELSFNPGNYVVMSSVSIGIRTRF